VLALPALPGADAAEAGERVELAGEVDVAAVEEAGTGAAAPRRGGRADKDGVDAVIEELIEAGVEPNEGGVVAASARGTAVGCGGAADGVEASISVSVAAGSAVGGGGGGSDSSG